MVSVAISTSVSCLFLFALIVLLPLHVTVYFVPEHPASLHSVPGATPLHVPQGLTMSSVEVKDGKWGTGRVVLLEDKSSQPRKRSFGAGLNPSPGF